MSLGLKILLAIGVIVALLLIAFVVLVVLVAHHLNKIERGLPWMKWVTLDDAIEMGQSEFWCLALLPVFHKDGQLQVRIFDDLDEQETELVRQKGFTQETVELHEFCIVKRGRRRKIFSLTSLAVLKQWLPQSSKPAYA